MTHEGQKPILLWHPQIHEFFNETLYFFALRFRGYSRSHIERLRGEMLGQGIRGICLYELFGAYDILVRAWLTSTMFAVVDGILEETPALASHPAVFKVTDMMHWAFPNLPDGEALKILLADKERINVAQEQAENEEKQSFDQYESSGIAKYSALGDQTIFYTTLNFSQLPVISLAVEKEIKGVLTGVYRNCLAGKCAVSKVNIFFGEGFSYALIKGAVNSLQGARDFIVEELVTSLKNLVPETTTFATCERNPYESDNISRDGIEHFQLGSSPLWIETWFPELYRLGSTPSEALAIESFLSSCQKDVQLLPEDQKISLLRPILEAVLTNDPRRAVTAVLPWFAEIESTLADNKTWFSFLRATTNLDSTALMEEDVRIREAVGLGRDTPKDITLGDILNKYVKALQDHDSESLANMGTPQPSELTHVRNVFAHGEIFSSLKDEWKRTVELLLWFLPLYDTLILSRVRGKSGRSEAQE